MPDMLKKSDVLNLLHTNGIRYVHSHRLVVTICRSHQFILFKNRGYLLWFKVIVGYRNIFITRNSYNQTYEVTAKFKLLFYLLTQNEQEMCLEEITPLCAFSISNPQ